MKVIAKFAGKYLSQRDNHKIYYLEGDWVYDFEGKKLFPVSDLDAKKEKLMDRSTQCFISAGAMFSESLYNAKLIKNKLDELSYLATIHDNLKRKETRFEWSSHKTVINKLLSETNFRFDYKFSKYNATEIIGQIDSGFPVIASIWIEPWLPHATGHMIVIRGYKVDEFGKITHFIIDDPFGNYNTRYKDHNGSSIEVPVSDWEQMIASPSIRPRIFSFLKAID